MPNFKQIREFVDYVNTHNEKDLDEDGHLGNQVDPNYWDLKAIKEDNALQNFKSKRHYDDKTVAVIYRDAKSLGLLERRDKSNSTHVQGVGIILTDDGRHFLETARPFNWKKGKWNTITKYYGSWSIALSAIAIVISIIALWRS